MYLQKLLQRNDSHWTRKILEHLDTLKIGWAKQIRKKLNEYSLEEDWSIIKGKTVGTWKTEVQKAINKRNKEILKQNCTKRENDKNAAKYKTKKFMKHWK